MKKGSSLLWLSIFFLFFVLILGFWWLYLLSESGKALNKMILWEGATFFILLSLSLAGFIILYIRDTKKNKTMAAFFSSLTHELKTPLASIRLQTEVLAEQLENLKEGKAKVISERLIEDTQKLEIQMDKVLQLSRMELGGNLSPTSIDLKSFIHKMFKRWSRDLDYTIDSKVESSMVMADEMALELIFKNLIENTNRHTTSKAVKITIHQNSPCSIELIYNDYGLFSGDPQKIATLFYKHNSTKGSGIGLYLVKKL
ncbi:MAG: HAMP domain-containing histidine kinase, partial [Bdellovibrionales bacterium]|nr:HAMP domain-containing histidine kinase [Bdellovibrionales bacterium]